MEEKSDVSFLQEIEDRLNVIFGEEEKAKRQPQQGGAPAGPQEVKPEQAPPAGTEEEAGAIGPDGHATASGIQISPLKDLKMIVLSLEWEINDETLKRLDDEVLRLEEVYADSVIPSAFLKIMRFLGRYLTTKGAESEPGSINLLLITYDNLEYTLLSRSMTEAEKLSLMRGNILKYRGWVEAIDLAAVGDETPPPGEQVFTDVLAVPTSEPEGEKGAGEEPGADAQAEEMTAEEKDETGEILIDPTLNAGVVPPGSGPGEPAGEDDSQLLQAETQAPAADADWRDEGAGDFTQGREEAGPPSAGVDELSGPASPLSPLPADGASAAAQEEIPQPVDRVETSDSGKGAVTRDELERAMEEVRAMMREEIRALREELRSWDRNR